MISSLHAQQLVPFVSIIRFCFHYNVRRRSNFASSTPAHATTTARVILEARGKLFSFSEKDNQATYNCEKGQDQNLK